MSKSTVERITAHLFDHLAVGLKEYSDKRQLGETGYPYPASLQYALNCLSVLFPLTSHSYPSTFGDLLSLFETEIREWWIDQTFATLPGGNKGGFQYSTLLYEGILTGDILEYLVDAKLDSFSGKAVDSLHDELLQKPIAEMQQLASRAPNVYGESYTTARRFIIEFPTVMDKELNRIKLDLPSDIYDLIRNLYDLVERDSSLYHEGKLWTCPHCKNILHWIDERPYCGRHDVCGRLFPDYIGRKPIKSGPFNQIYTVKRSVHARTCIPGIPEVRLYDALGKKDLKSVVMWPGGDKYDIRLEYHTDEVWALDVKDYANPHTLAKKIKDDFRKQFNWKNDPLLGWNKFFYVVPDYRIDWDKHYIDALNNFLIRNKIPTRAYSISKLLSAVSNSEE